MVKCDHCNTENEENTTKCKNCGKDLSKKPTKGIDRKIWMVVGIAVLVLVVGTLIYIVLTPAESALPDFDKSLIQSVQNGEPTADLVAKIQNYAQLNRANAKTAYEALIAGNESQSSSGFLDQAKTDYNRELDYIQKIQDVQMQFVNGEINKETFIYKMKQVYAQKPDMDF